MILAIRLSLILFEISLCSFVLLVSCVSSHKRTDPCLRSVATAVSEKSSDSVGGLTSSEVACVLRQNLNAFRHCYEQVLQRQPGVHGKVTVKFVIDVNGLVSEEEIVSSNIDDSYFKKCVLSQISRLKFPKPRGGQTVEISYPFVFNPV